MSDMPPFVIPDAALAAIRDLVRLGRAPLRLARPLPHKAPAQGRSDANWAGATIEPEARRTMTKHDIFGGPHDKT